MDAIAIVVEDGVQVQHTQARLDSTFMIARKRGSQIEQDEAETIVSSRVLDFFWRIITRVTEYFTRIRRFFVFTPAKEGSIEFKEGRGLSENGIKVEEGLVQSYGACKPELDELIVSEKETTNHSQDRDADLNAAELHHEDHEDCGSKYCTLQIKVDEHQSGISDDCKRTPSGETHEDSVTEHTLVTVQPTCVPHQEESNSLTCDSTKVVIQLCQDDCEIYNLQITVNEQSGACDVYKPTLGIDNHDVRRDVRKTEYPSRTEQATGDPYQQEPHSVTCEPVEAFPLELNDGHCAGEAQHQKCQTQEQNASQEDLELPDVVISNKCIMLQAPSPPSVACNLKLDKSVEDGSPEPPNLSTSSKSLNRMFSIQHLNAIVAEQLTKYLQILERSMVSKKAEHSIWSHRTTHRRAIILATLVAVAVWARNAKHLYESVPRIKGSAINVHIRSRL